jgi:hypothetical protein
MITIETNDVFTPGAPQAAFIASQVGAGRKATLLGTMSSVNPVVLRVEATDGSAAPAMFVWTQQGYKAWTWKYPVVLEVELRTSPAGVKVTYPAWSAPVLAGRTSTITEVPGTHPAPPDSSSPPPNWP